jgi:hypothetical protein
VVLRFSIGPSWSLCGRTRLWLCYSVGAVFETARYSASLCPYRTSRTINRGSPARTVSVNETLTVPDRQHRQQKGNKQRMPCSKRSRKPRADSSQAARLLPSADVAVWTRSDLRKAAMACTHGVGRGAAGFNQGSIVTSIRYIQRSEAKGVQDTQLEHYGTLARRQAREMAITAEASLLEDCSDPAPLRRSGGCRHARTEDTVVGQQRV